MLDDAKKAVKKVGALFDDATIENRNLMWKLRKIYIQKSSSAATVAHHEIAGGSMGKNPRTTKRDREIKEGNRRMIGRIISDNAKFIGKKELKQQFKEY